MRFNLPGLVLVHNVPSRSRHINGKVHRYSGVSVSAVTSSCKVVKSRAFPSAAIVGNKLHHLLHRPVCHCEPGSRYSHASAFRLHSNRDSAHANSTGTDNRSAAHLYRHLVLANILSVRSSYTFITIIAILMPSCISSSTAPLQLKLKTVCEHGETHVAADIISNTPSAHRRSNTFQTIRTLNTCFRRFFAQEIMFCVKAERPLTWAIQMSQATHFFHSHSA